MRTTDRDAELVELATAQRTAPVPRHDHHRHPHLRVSCRPRPDEDPYLNSMRSSRQIPNARGTISQMNPEVAIWAHSSPVGV
jgi:hypothetical protein